MRVLVGADSIHTTATACDFLESRLGPSDTLVLLTVTDSTVTERDGADAANVARARLGAVTVESVQRSGDPVTLIGQIATDRNVDEIVLGAVRGDPATAGDAPGSTVRSLLAETSRPITVVPV